MALSSECEQQRIVSLDVYREPTIAKILVEYFSATRQGIKKFLKKYEECGTMGRQEGAGQKTKINTEV